MWGWLSHGGDEVFAEFNDAQSVNMKLCALFLPIGVGGVVDGGWRVACKSQGDKNTIAGIVKSDWSWQNGETIIV